MRTHLRTQERQLHGHALLLPLLVPKHISNNTIPGRSAYYEHTDKDLHHYPGKDDIIRLVAAHIVYTTRHQRNRNTNEYSRYNTSGNPPLQQQPRIQYIRIEIKRG